MKMTVVPARARSLAPLIALLSLTAQDSSAVSLARTGLIPSGTPAGPTSASQRMALGAPAL